jgi:hypothetical protein
VAPNGGFWSAIATRPAETTHAAMTISKHAARLSKVRTDIETFGVSFRTVIGPNP